MSRNIQISVTSSCASELTTENGKWSFTVTNGKSVREVSGVCEGYSVNQMELKSIVEALKFANNTIIAGRSITLFTNSLYIKNGVTKWLADWKKNNFVSSKKDQVKNKELWLELDALIVSPKIEWNWTKGSNVASTTSAPTRSRRKVEQAVAA